MIDPILSPYAATLLRVSRGMPAFIAWPVVLLEIAGGTLVLLGDGALAPSGSKSGSPTRRKTAGSTLIR